MDKKKKIRITVSAILCVFISFVTILLTVCTAFHYSVCTPEGVERSLNSVKYTELVKNYLYERAKKISTPAKIPDGVANEFIDEIVTKEVAERPIMNSYYAVQTKTDYEAAEKVIYEKIHSYAEEFREGLEIKITDDEWKEINDGLSDLVDYYREEIYNDVEMKLFTPIYRKLVSKYCKIFPYILGFTAAFVLAGYLLLILINKGKIKYFVSYVLFTGTGILTVPAAFLLSNTVKSKVKTFGFDPEYIRVFVGEEIITALNICIISGIVLFSLGLLFFGIYKYINKSDNEA